MFQAGQPPLVGSLHLRHQPTDGPGLLHFADVNLPLTSGSLRDELLIYYQDLLKVAADQDCLIPNRLISDCFKAHILATRFTGAATSVSSMGGSVSFQTLRAKVKGEEFSAVLASLQHHKAEFLNHNDDAQALWRLQGVVDFESPAELARAVASLANSLFVKEATLPLGNGMTRLFIAENGHERSGLTFTEFERLRKPEYLDELDIEEYSPPQILRVTDLNEEPFGFAAKLQLTILLTRVNPQMTLQQLDGLTLPPNDLFVAVRIPQSNELPPVICGCAVLEKDTEISGLTEFTDWIVVGSEHLEYKKWNRGAGMNLLREAVHHHKENYPELVLYGEFNKNKAEAAASNYGFSMSRGRMHLHVPIDGILADFEVLQYGND